MKAISYTIITSLLLTLLFACTSEQDTSPKKNSALNENIKNTKLPRKYSDMLRAMSQNPTKYEEHGFNVNQIAEYYLESGSKKNAADILKKGIQQYSKSSNNEKNITMLLAIMKEDEAKKQDYINFVQALSSGYPNLEGLAEYKADIPKGEPSLSDKIKSIQSNLTNTSTGRLDLPKVNEFVSAIEYYVMGNPKSEESPKYLKLAAEVVNSIKVYPRAIQFYDWILTQFPNSKQAPQAMFMKGFTLDDGMKNKAAAKPVYEAFLKMYPDNDFADDTKFLLENINKSDEEIIKQFDKAKNK